MIACQNRERDLEDFHAHENQLFPPSISQGGQLRSCSKSDLIPVLQNISSLKNHDAQVNVDVPISADTEQQHQIEDLQVMIDTIPVVSDDVLRTPPNCSFDSDTKFHGWRTPQQRPQVDYSSFNLTSPFKMNATLVNIPEDFEMTGVLTSDDMIHSQKSSPYFSKSPQLENYISDEVLRTPAHCSFDSDAEFHGWRTPPQRPQIDISSFNLSSPFT